MLVFVVCCFTVFCTDNANILREEAKKTSIKRKEILDVISEKWDFKPADFSQESYNIIQQWAEWNNFYNELLQKPQTDISAFHRKTTQLVKQVENLQTTIPETFNKTEIQSRLSVLEAKFKILKIYITLDDISSEKIIQILTEINAEIESIVNRIKTILEKDKFQYEKSEIEMLQSLNSPQNSNDNNN